MGENIQVEDALDKEGSHNFVFTFKAENPFFNELTLTKKIQLHPGDDASPTITPAVITWKQEPFKYDEEEENCISLFQWLQSSEEESESDDWGVHFREKLWDDAFDVYATEYGME